MSTATATRKISPSQVSPSKVVAGYFVWNVRRPGQPTLFSSITGQKGQWEVTHRTDLGQEPEVVATVTSLNEAKVVLAALYNGEDPQAALAAHQPKARRKGPESVSPTEAGVKVGDFFYSSGGYDQTNVNFYQVVGLTPKGVKIREVYKVFLEQDGPHDSVVPGVDKFIGEPITKVLKTYGSGRVYLAGEYSWSGLYLWDGQPMYQTGWGYGH